MKPFAIVTLAVLLAFAGAVQAATDEEKCRDAILKEAGKYLKAQTKTLTKCNDSILKGKDGFNDVLGPGCRDDLGKTQGKLDTATSKFEAAIDKKCGGDDKDCNTQDDLDINDPAIGWGFLGDFGDGILSYCPDFEQRGCRNVIQHCGGLDSNGEGITDCVLCLNDTIIDQTMDLLYADLDAAEFGTSNDTNKCQQEMVKVGAKHVLAKSKTLGKCWQSINKAKDGFSSSDAQGCIDASGKTGAKIDKSESKKIAAICKKCGGPDDKACDQEIDTIAGTAVNGALPGQGTGGDLDPIADIGFGTECPDVVLPYPPNTNCGTLDNLPSGSQDDVIENMQEFVRCLDCVLEFKVDCADRSVVPDHQPLPDECNACVADTDGDPCPTVIEVTADPVDANLDNGWTGQGHDARVPTNGVLTLNVSSCAGANRPTCGECDVSGPIENVGAASSLDHRCAGNNAVECSDDGDCPGTGPCVFTYVEGEQFNNRRCRDDNTRICSADSDCPSGQCVFYFGVPLPLEAGGIATCVVNEIQGAITGTADIEAGSSASTISLISSVFLGTDAANPCPKCLFDAIDNRHECSFGARANQPCIVHSRSTTFGDLSWDCPPLSPSVGDLPIVLNPSTGLTTRTLTAAQPACSASGASTFKCFCDTCDDASNTACSTDADCIAAGNGGTICGGRRCLPPSVNEGAACGADSDCTGGLCGLLGEPTRPNSCNTGICTPKAGDTGTIDEGECTGGPNKGRCSIEIFRGCTNDLACQQPPAGSCASCLPGQTCIFGPRECFLDNGTIGGEVKVQGVADAGCGNIAEPVLGTMFCIAPVGATAVNSSAGLPGLGRLHLPITAVFDPTP